MTTQPTEFTTVTTNLEASIATYSTDARTLYTKAHDDIQTAKDEALKAAQTRLASAFAQLSTAASLQADQADRIGLAAVMQLMETVADSADKLTKKLLTLLKADQAGVTMSVDERALADRVTTALGVLAQLSPSDAWAGRAASARG